MVKIRSALGSSVNELVLFERRKKQATSTFSEPFYPIKLAHDMVGVLFLFSGLFSFYILDSTFRSYFATHKD